MARYPPERVVESVAVYQNWTYKQLDAEAEDMDADQICTQRCQLGTERIDMALNGLDLTHPARA